MKELIMDEPTEPLSKKVISYILPAACGMIMGFIFFRGKIFQPHVTLFQFVIISVEASIIFNILKDTNLKNSIAAAFVIFMVNSFFTYSFYNLSYLLRDLLYILAVFLSVYFFFRFFYLKFKTYFYPLAFGILLLFLHFIVDLTLMIIYAVPEFWRRLNNQVTIAALIGVGLGLGIFINDTIVPLLTEKEEKVTDDENDSEE